MNAKWLWIAAAAVAASGCGADKSSDNALNDMAADNGLAANAMANQVVAAPESAPASPAAAKAVVDAYAGLAEKGSFADAAKHWTNATAAAQFAASLEDYPKVRMSAGAPIDEEGAAGSIFITVPLTLDLTLRSGSPYQMTCKATLRRVNDVPGSSAQQRRWHIESIDC